MGLNFVDSLFGIRSNLVEVFWPRMHINIGYKSKVKHSGQNATKTRDRNERGAMEKICIVKRRKTTAEASLEPVVEIHAASLVASPVSDQEIAGIEQMPEVSLPGPMIASPESFNIHDGDHLIFKEVAGEEEQIFSIQLDPEQSQVVQSMNCIKDLLSGRHHGVEMSMEAAPDGSTAFNFHFKPVYTTRMLNVNDVSVMLQVSKSMLYRLVKRKEIKSYKIGKLRRFLLEDVVDYLSHSVQM